MAELFIKLSDGQTFRSKLATVSQVVGRDRSCDIPIDDPSTSRRHARFTPTSDGYLVEDLGSKNGTYVNDEPCVSQVVRDGDTIILGSVVLEYHDSETTSVQSVVIEEDEVSASRATKYASRDQQLLLSQQRLQMIYELSERLTALRSQDCLLEEAMAICFETLHFERGAIGVRRAGQRPLDWPVVHNLHGSEGDLKISGTLLRRALEHGERAIFTDDGSQAIDPTISMVQQGIQSAMCVPLLHREEILGVVYGDRVSTSTSYSQEDIDFLAAIARQVSIGLINWRLVEEQKAMVRLNHDIDLARAIQTGLFPTALPSRPALKIAAINDPGQRVSGDYYDVIETDDGRLWLLIADVTGEGVAAALLMANLQAAVRVTISEGDDPGKLLARWNDLICANTGASKFVTCLLILVDPASRQVRCSTAGHHPPLILRGQAATPTELEVEPGYPLGVLADAEYATALVDVGTDPFLIVCYTDGVLEAMDVTGGQFGMKRLLSVLTDTQELNPQAIVKKIRKAVAQFTGAAAQSDDITLLAARVG